MRRGDFERAWRLCDASLGNEALRDPSRPRHLQSVWTGAALRGQRVLVRCYHGLGDTIQFVRYAAPLKKIASEVILWAQPELLTLLRSARGVDRLLALHDGTPECAYDVDVEIMELPHVFRSTLETLPREVPYLDAPAAALDPGRARPGSRPLNVGLAWRAGGWDDRRDVPFELASRIARVPGIAAWALQREPRAGEAGGLVRWSSLVRTVRGTARLVRALDLVVSIDSMPAHLAGALGVPVWTLLPRDCDWRWMEAGEETPWYPTMRLFRQSSPGEWERVVDRVAGELAELAASRQSQRISVGLYK
jgi:hypothetical protein